jgi:hypothetical protein
MFGIWGWGGSKVFRVGGWGKEVIAGCGFSGLLASSGMALPLMLPFT